MMATAPVVVRGGGELGTAAARLLFLSGFPVVVLERAQPLAVRRLVAFSEAVLTGESVVEGVVARRSPVAQLGPAADFVAVAVDPEGAVLARLRPYALVDARMQKHNRETTRGDAALVIGLGPGFVAGDDVHAVIETQRGPDLGRVLWAGSAEPDSMRPAAVLGYTEKRVVRAPGPGRFLSQARIGDAVIPGQVLGLVDAEPVRAAIAGLVRGLIADGVEVPAGIKIGDIDPRGPSIDPARVSDKARAIAAGVLEAVLISRRRSLGETTGQTVLR
ncbi:MAG: EF2563 family selenium-dependent molybdenum hydroxylase system protein [Acidobacteria bacterium]|nr:MAG: EF2563 family selenium-dependent molybdenum hydroxylase system protein [Acidobacteriota bacterium]